MLSSGVLRPVTLVRTDVSEEYMASIIRVTEIDELGAKAHIVLRFLVTANVVSNKLTFHPDDGGDTFL
jgi:Zn-dependent M32 family carboxypeptidase